MVDDSEYCPRCGQNRSTHDDGECDAVKRSMTYAAKKVFVVQPGPGVQEIARRLQTIAGVAHDTHTLEGLTWLDEQLDSIKELVAFEAWKMENGKRKDGKNG